MRLTANEVGVLKPLGGSNPLVSAHYTLILQQVHADTEADTIVSVLSTIKKAINFMSRREKFKFSLFLSFRAVVAIFDLVGILAIGYLATSMAFLLSSSTEKNERVFIGSLSLPTVSPQSLTVLAALVVSLFIVKAVVSILLTRQLANFLAGIEARAARVIAKNAFGSGLEGSRLKSLEEVLFAVTQGSPSAFNWLLNSTGALVAEGFLFILVLLAFAFVDPVVALVSILYFAIIGILIQFFIGRLMIKASARIAETTVAANRGLSNLNDVIREATILDRLDFFYDAIYRSRVKSAGSTASQIVLLGMPRYIVETALILGIALFILAQSLSGDIASSAATIGIFLSGGLRLTASLLPLQSALLVIKQTIPMSQSALSMLEINQTANRNNADKSSVTPNDSSPLSVSVKNLVFSYQGASTETLKGLTLEIQSGSQAAFIGPSGSGKSTLADLLLGLLNPTSGEILVGGSNPSKLLSHRPGLVGYVPQKPGMISGSIAQNIALGVPEEEVDPQKLWKAIRDAHLTSLVDSLPDGVETNIGKRKDQLSGGQLQRIGLARALYSEPRLLIMDEATSALDAESEDEINRVLNEMRGKVTVILIAHRLNTIQRSDVVYLVENGTITASGSFSELRSKNSRVKNLVKLMEIESKD